MLNNPPGPDIQIPNARQATWRLKIIWKSCTTTERGTGQTVCLPTWMVDWYCKLVDKHINHEKVGKYTIYIDPMGKLTHLFQRNLFIISPGFRPLGILWVFGKFYNFQKNPNSQISPEKIGPLDKFDLCSLWAKLRSPGLKV